MRSFHYLASPYTKHKCGIETAFVMAARVAGQFVRAGISVFSPIVHSHVIAQYGHIEPTDHETWLLIDAPFMRAARALIVYQADGWQESVGVKFEIERFTHYKKPIEYLMPDNLDPEYLRTRFAKL